MTEFAIILAGGIGTRMKTDLPKQFLLLRGKPIIFHTIEKFYNYNNQISIVIVLPKTSMDYWFNLCLKYKFSIPHQTAEGGSERFYSVQNGLLLVDENSLVAIHDAVRSGVGLDTIKRCFKMTREKGNAIPIIPITDSLRRVDANSTTAVDRKNMYAVQTPQCFASELIKKAYKQNFSASFTDDASVLEKTGASLNFVQGNRENIKVTFPDDLTYIDAIL